MQHTHDLDLRYPIGGLFLVLGLLLAGFGVVTSGNPEIYLRATSMNINLRWGLVMMAFGAIMWGLARRARTARTMP